MDRPQWLCILFLLGIHVLFGQAESPNLLISDTVSAERIQLEANALMDEGKMEQAILRYQSLRDWYLDQENWEKAVYSYLDLGLCAYYLENYFEAETILEEGFSLAEEYILSSDPCFGILFQMLGVMYNYTGNYDQSLKRSLQALSYYREAPPDVQESENNLSSILSTNCHNVGFAYLERGDFIQAKDYLKESLRIEGSREDPDPMALIASLHALSDIFFKIEAYEKSLAQCRKQRELLASLKGQDLATSSIQVNNIFANIFNELGQHDSALLYLQQAMDWHEIVPGRLNRTLHNLAYTYRLSERFPEAKYYLQQAIEKTLALNSPDFPLVAKDHRHWGVIASQEGNYEEALEHFQLSLAYLSQDFSNKSPHSNPSLDSTKLPLPLLRTLRDKSTALYLQAQTAGSSKMDLLESSFRTQQLALQLVDQLRREYTEGSSQFFTKEFFPFFESGLEVALQLYQETGDNLYLEAAFEYSEKSKAVTLLGAIREAGARKSAGVPDSIYQKEKAFHQELAFYGKKIFTEKTKVSGGDEAKIIRWEQKVFELNRAKEALIQWLETHSPEYFRLKYQTETVPMAAVQQALTDSPTVLVSYFYGDRALYAFVISSSGLSANKLDWNEGWDEELNGFLRHINDPNAAMENGKQGLLTFAAEAHTWYSRLLAPLLPKVTFSHLLIIPDGMLSYLPFEALLSSLPPSPQSYHELPFLFMDWDIHYAYSSSLMLEKEARNLSGPRLAGFAPDYGKGLSQAESRSLASKGDLNPLMYNQPEVEMIADLMGGKAFLGSQATESAFKRIPEAQVLHLAMHGVINDADPMYSGLAFGKMESPGESLVDDGFLHAFELYNLRLNTHLAVLSACQTGAGKMQRGEGVMSLSRAFRYAGCPNLVMSLWQADDRATFDLMQSFYQHLQSGKGKAMALRQAKLDYFEQHDETHPFFWAGFVLMGDNKPLPAHRHFPPWIAWAGVFLLACLTIGVIWKYRKNPSQ